MRSTGLLLAGLAFLMVAASPSSVYGFGVSYIWGSPIWMEPGSIHTYENLFILQNFTDADAEIAVEFIRQGWRSDPPSFIDLEREEWISSYPDAEPDSTMVSYHIPSGSERLFPAEIVIPTEGFRRRNLLWFRFYYYPGGMFGVRLNRKIFILVRLPQELSVDGCSHLQDWIYMANSISAYEGDTGTKTWEFTVRRSPADESTLSVDYFTVDDTATAGSDYESTSGTLLFGPNEDSKTISVNVHCDREQEVDERFYLWLTDPTDASFHDLRVTGVIKDDDFVSELQTLTVSSTAGGSVSMPGEGAFKYEFGESIQVTADVDENHHFVGWSGTAVDAGAVADPNSTDTTVVVDGNYTLQADLAIDRHVLRIYLDSGGDLLTPHWKTGHDHGTVVPIRVGVSNPNYYFTTWAGTGVDAGKVADPDSMSTTITVDDDYDLRAHYAGYSRVLLVSSTVGGSVVLPGEGSLQYEHGAVLPISAVASDHYHFNRWTGTAADRYLVADRYAADTSVAINGDSTLQADFAIEQHTLDVSSTKGGVVLSPGERLFSGNYHSIWTLEVIPEVGYHFAGWSGTAVDAGKVAEPGAAHTTVTLDADYTVQANFSINQYTLSVSSTAGGSVSTPGEGTYGYDHGTAVSIEAAAESHYHFVGWSGTAVDAGKVTDADSASTTVTVDEAYTLRALFTVDQQSLTVSSGSGGSVMSPGEGATVHDYGSAVSLTATPEANYHFVSWSGTAVDAGKVADASSASTTVTLDADYSLHANFAINQRMLTTSSTVGGLVSAPGEGSFEYEHGTVVVLTAASDGAYLFVGWSGTAVDAGKVAEPGAAHTTVTLDADYTVQANFSINQYTLSVSSTAGGSVSTPGEGDRRGFSQYDSDCG